MMDSLTFKILEMNNHKVKSDKTLKSMKKDSLVEYIRQIEHNWAIALERCDNQYRLLTQEYEWHDVLKDPNDLPKEGMLIMYKFRVRADGSFGYNSAEIIGDFYMDVMKNQKNEYAEYVAWTELNRYEDGESE